MHTLPASISKEKHETPFELIVASRKLVASVSSTQRPEEAGPWPNPPTEAEQLQALMAAANEVSEATGTLGAGTMGLSTRYSPQFTLQHVPDYRQNVYIPGSTTTLAGNNAQPDAKIMAAAAPTASKKKPGKKEKK
ncbi:PCDG4 protein, partial [Polypterus senegalus]